ncbi:MAG: hypothetical protein LBL48_03720 [Azoarcus sp.]|jgi:hypothetical protein|nr:hypothetical protein [Azoarcus sp.]
MAQLKRQASDGDSPADQEDDLDVLAPERAIMVGGETVTVREYSFGEQLKHGALLSELTGALRPALSHATSGGAQQPGDLLDALAAHSDEVLAAIALSVDRPVEWVAALSGEDGEALALTWWGVNMGFFVRRLVTYPSLVAAVHQKLATSDGAPSSPCSSATDTLGAN